MSYFIRAFLVDLSCSPRNPPFVAGMLLLGRLIGIGWRVVSCARPTAGIIVLIGWARARHNGQQSDSFEPGALGSILRGAPFVGSRALILSEFSRPHACVAGV